MSDDALLATMDELSGCLRLRDEHKANISAAQVALGKLEAEIVRLREELAGHLRGYGVEPARPDLDSWAIIAAPEPPTTRPSKLGGRRIAPAAISPAAREALETIKASGPDGVPARALRTEGWVFGQLTRAHLARKLPNGNWVAA